MNFDSQRRPAVILFNPFIFVAGAQALLLGIGAILLAGLIGSLSNTHFDGVLDTHSGRSLSLWFFALEGFLDWLCLSVVLLVVGRIFSKTSFRAIDLFGTQALARWPALLIGLIALPPAFQRFSHYLLTWILHPQAAGEFNVIDAAIFAMVAVGMILLLCWMVALMYRAFSVSCNIKGARAIGAFTLGIVVAEILSKVVLHGLIVTTLAAPAGSQNGIATAPAKAGEETAATAAAKKWLNTIDNGSYLESWGDAATLFQAAVKSNQWVHSMETFRKPLGSVTSRKLNNSQAFSRLPGVPDGNYIVMQFNTSFVEKKSAIETVTMSLEKDGQWKSSGYFIK